MYDVAIIGGGPVGSQVAYLLAGAGYKVVVLEKKPRLGIPVCCAGIISEQCLSSFAISKDLIIRRVNSGKLFSPSGKQIHLQNERIRGCIVDRAAFDTFLAERAQESGAIYFFNHRVDGFRVSTDKVEVNTCSGGEVQPFEARVAVLASGFNPRLLIKAGFSRVNKFVVGIQARVCTKGVDEVEIYFGREVAPYFFAWLVPTLPNQALVGLATRNNPGRYLQKLLLSLKDSGVVTDTDIELCYRGISLNTLDKTYATRLLVVGDAAGQVKPTTGGGVYFGLLCAELAAKTLDVALSYNDLSTKRLAGYQRAWQRKLGREFTIGNWARKFFEQLSNRQIDHVFDIIKTHQIDKDLAEAEELTFDWHSKTVMKLIKHQVLAKTLGIMNIAIGRTPSSH